MTDGGERNRPLLHIRRLQDKRLTHWGHSWEHWRLTTVLQTHVGWHLDIVAVPVCPVGSSELDRLGSARMRRCQTTVSRSNWLGLGDCWHHIGHSFDLVGRVEIRRAEEDRTSPVDVGVRIPDLEKGSRRSPVEGIAVAAVAADCSLVVDSPVEGGSRRRTRLAVGRSHPGRSCRRDQTLEF